MSSTRSTISMDPATSEAALQRAQRSGMSLSAYVARAVRRSLVRDAMDDESRFLEGRPDVAAAAAADAFADEADRAAAAEVDSARAARRRAA
jgi:hypothetical protein